jgi:hypothetical protein
MERVVQVIATALADGEVEIRDCFAHIRELLSRINTVGATDVFGSWGPRGRQVGAHGNTRGTSMCKFHVTLFGDDNRRIEQCGCEGGVMWRSTSQRMEVGQVGRIVGNGPFGEGGTPTRASRWVCRAAEATTVSCIRGR